jgi:transposase-like protein
MNDNRGRNGQLMYAEAFKLKIIELLENGEHNLNEIVRIYEIGGANTIYNWLRKYGKEHLIGTRKLVVKAEEISQMSKMREKTKQAEQENKEIALELYYSKALLETAFEQMTEAQKKSIYMKLSPELLRRLKLMGIKCP